MTPAQYNEELDEVMSHLRAHSGAHQRRSIVDRFAQAIARAQRDICIENTDFGEDPEASYYALQVRLVTDP